MIDLRSDTVTRPTPAMRRAMIEAEVGDDVYGEDPTVNRLEQRAAEIAGKEAGLFVPTGTMGNTIGVKVHTEHGQEVICDSRAHLLNYELSMLAWFSGCVPRPIATGDGILTWAQIRREIRPLGPHWAPTGLIEIENTHNMAGGTVYPPEVVRRDLRRRARARPQGPHGWRARLQCGDCPGQSSGARDHAPADTVMFCLSKGLGAPVRLDARRDRRGDRSQARLYRKRLGGGMRQAGVLAAAGLIALEEMPARLCEDHENAQVPRRCSRREFQGHRSRPRGPDQHRDLRRRRNRNRRARAQRASEERAAC